MLFNKKNKARESVVEAFEREGERIQKSTELPLFEHVFASMPNPPQEDVEGSEFLTLVGKNFSSVRSAANNFLHLVHMIMINKHLKNKSVCVDFQRHFEFNMLEDGIDIKVLLVDQRRNESKEITYENMEYVLTTLLEELNVFQEHKENQEYEFVLYDTSFLREPSTFETTEEKQIRYRKIDELYMQLKRSGRFTRDQLTVIYKLMHMGYDINCFACYLFLPSDMQFLASIYSISVQAQLGDAKKLEDFLRNFRRFCEKNFKKTFSSSQFSRVFTAANEGQQEEMLRDPDFDVLFLLDALIDEALASADATTRYTIDGKTYIVTAHMIYDAAGKFQKTKWKIELEGEQSGAPRTVIFDTTIHELNFSKEPACFLKELCPHEKIAKVSKVEEKSGPVDIASEIARLYYKTIEDYYRTEDTNVCNILSICNGDEFLFMPKKYLDGRKEVNGKHPVQTKYGAKIVLKTVAGKQVAFFDISTVTSNGMFVPQVKGDLTKVEYYYKVATGVSVIPGTEKFQQIIDSIMQS